VAAALGVTALWALTRDTHQVMVLAAAAIAAGWLLLGGRRREAAAATIGLVAIFAVSSLSATRESAYPRWERPLVNVIGSRVLDDPDRLDWFRDRGMPVPAALAPHAGKHLGAEVLDGDDPLYRDPRVQPFLDWVHDSGRPEMLRYLVSHPGYALEPLVTKRGPLLDPEPDGYDDIANGPVGGYRVDGTARALPGFVDAVVYARPPEALLAWALLLAAAAAWLLARGRGSRLWIVPAAGVALQAPHALAVWHGDSAEVARHAVVLGAATRLCLLVLTLMLVDAAVSRSESMSETTT
jgi:hypothetical protein